MSSAVQMSSIFPGRILLKPSFRKYRTAHTPQYTAPSTIDFSDNVVCQKKTEENGMTTAATNSLFASAFQKTDAPEKKTVKVDYSKFKITKRSKPAAKCSIVDELAASFNALSL